MNRDQRSEEMMTRLVFNAVSDFFFFSSGDETEPDVGDADNQSENSLPVVNYLNNSLKYVSNVFPLLDEVINVDVMIDMIELG